MNDISNMEKILKEIKELRGLEGLSNGRVLVSLFSDLSSDKKDLRMIRYLVESGCHTDLLGARELSPAMQQARLQQTVNKLCAETLVSEEASRQVCTAFWNVVYGPAKIQDQKEVRALQPSKQPELPKQPEPKKQPEAVQERMPASSQQEMTSGEEESSGSQIGKIVLFGVLLLVCLIVFIPMLMFTPSTPSSQVQTPPVTTAAPPEEISLSEYIQRTQSQNGSRVLRPDPVQYNVGANGQLVTYPAFGTFVNRDEIASITFLNTLKDAPENAMDLSDAYDGSVQAWVVPNGKLVDLYIAAEGGVKAPKDSGGLFAQCVNATSISFNNSFDTSGAVFMDSMFYECKSLTEVDLSGADTGKVETMAFFFHGCNQLTALDLNHFDTSNVTSFAFMFAGCTGLKTLSLDHFNTSRAEDMGGMFSGCWELEKLDLSSFNTAKVTDMGFMFDSCLKLSDLNVSSFETSSVTRMNYMFYNTQKLQNLDLSGFDVSKVTEYDQFMKPGMQINGRAWEQFFK